MSSASFLTQLLVGLEAAFRDFADEIGVTGAPVGLLERLGWTVPANTDLAPVKDAFGELGIALTSLSNAAHALSQIPEDASLEDFAPVLADMTVAIAEAIAGAVGLSSVQPAAMPAPFSDESLWASLAEEAVDLLLIRYLEREQALISGVLRIVGVITEEVKAAGPLRGAYVKRTLDWNALGQAFSKPDQIMSRVYGWGGAFNADLLLRNLTALMEGFNLSPARFGPTPVLRDLYYSPTNPARQSLQQLSVPLYWERSSTDPFSNVLAVDLQLGLLPIPAAGDPSGPTEGLVLFPSLQGSAALRLPIADSTNLTIEGGFQAALVRVDIHPTSTTINVLPVAAQFSGSALVEAKPREPWILLGTKDSSRLELDGAHAKVGVRGSSTDLEAMIGAGIDGARVVIQLNEGDGFLTKVFGTDPQEIPFSLGATWSSKTGFRFEGQIALDLTLPLNLSIGGVFTIDALYITLGASTSGTARVTLAVAASVKLGPLSGAVDRLGIALDLVPRDNTTSPGNLGPLDLRFGFKPPAGAGMALQAGPVTGGGYIFFDPENEQYAGILQLSFKTIGITAIGLLTTRLPDPAGPPGSTKKGFSLLIIITVDLPPIQLGYGFTLNGVGGLLGINRTMVVNVLRDGVRNGTVEAILFPPDPIGRATEIISTLRSVFPPAEGRFVFGPMVKIGWGPNSLIEIQVALILELMSPIRLVVLGRIQIALPDKKDPVLNLRLDVVGVLDFDRGEASVDASLVDSRIAVFAITGDMSMRVGWGASKIFVIAAGGFNPRFQPPPDFPVLRRLAIALANSDNPRVRMETYFALTSNTIQIGAGIDVYAKMETFVGTFSVAALLGFDALVQFQPFALTAELGASVDIERDGSPLLHAALQAAFTGPNPWRIVGFAEFDFMGKHRIDFDAIIGEPAATPPITMLPSALLDDLATAFGRSDAWAALPPADAERVVSLRDQPAGDRIRIHPLGSLSARQRVLPFGKVIERFGAAEVKATTFTFGGFRVGAAEAAKDPAEYLLDDFAPGQFTPLTDDERVARPAFESMRSGGRIAVSEFLLPPGATAGVPGASGYEESIVDDEPVSGARLATVLTATGAAIPAAAMKALAHGGAAGRAAIRSGGATEFGGTTGVAVGVQGERYVATDSNTLAPLIAGASATSAAEAYDTLRASTSPAAPVARDRRQVALAHEAA